MVPRVPADLHAARGGHHALPEARPRVHRPGGARGGGGRRRPEAAARRRSSSTRTRTTRPTSSATSRSGTTARSSAGSPPAATATTSRQSIALGLRADGAGRPRTARAARLRDRDHRAAPAGPAPARAAVRPAGSPDAPVTEAPRRRAAAVGSSSTGGRSPFEAGDSVAVAILRGGRGARAAAGRCASPATAATAWRQVDGVAYVRTCQIAAAAGAAGRAAPGRGDAGTPRGGRRGPDLDRRCPSRSSCTISRSTSRSSAAGRAGWPRPPQRNGPATSVRVLDAHAGDEVVAIYAGPMIVVRDAGRDAPRRRPRDRRRDRCGRDPAGLPGQPARRDRDRAGRRAPARGRRGPRPRSSRSGRRPTACRARWSTGARPLRGDGRVTAVVTADRDRHRDDDARPTRSSSISAWRRATSWRGWPATVPVTRRRRRRPTDQPLPPPPTDGRRLPAAWARPSTTSTTPGTAASPSSSCSSARAWPVLGHVPGRRLPAARPGLDRGHGPASSPTPFTARPAVAPDHARRGRRRHATSTRSGGRRSTTSTSPLGARMDRFGGWWRPWHYGDVVARVLGGPRGRLDRRRVDARQADRLRARTSSSSSSGSTRATSRTSSPAARATRCCSTSAATSWTTA